MFQRGKVWYDRIEGKRVSSGTSDKRDAEAYFASLKKQSWDQQRMGVTKPRSWKECAAQWVIEKRSKKTIKLDIQRLGWWVDFLGDVDDINKINRQMIDELIQKHRAVDPSQPCPENTTANKYVQVVRQALKAAEDEWGWGNRAPKLRLYPVNDQPTQWLTVEQWKKLESFLKPHDRLVAKFSLATGLRLRNVLELRRDQIDLKKGVLTAKTKTVQVTIPLNRTAIEAAEEALAGPVPHLTHVFVCKGRVRKQYGGGWYTALERAGLGRFTGDRCGWEGFHFHGLRKTYNTWLANAGVPREVRKKLMGHVSKQDAHDVYTEYEVETLRKYSQTIDSLLTSAVSTNLSQSYG